MVIWPLDANATVPFLSTDFRDLTHQVGKNLTLWSIREQGEIKALDQGRPLRTNAAFIDPDFRSAYDWMKQKLTEKAAPPSGVNEMVWAWHQANGAAKPKPDLRQRWGTRQGEELALVEFEVNEAQTLLSDYQAWHFPLNNWFLPQTEQEIHAIDTDSLHPSQGDVQNSWNAIFDKSALSEEAFGPVHERQIQAVVWEILPDAVRAVRHFKSR